MSNAQTLVEIHRERRDEYDRLMPEEKAELVEAFTVEKEARQKAVRITARSRIQDIANGVRNLEQIVGFPLLLKMRTSPVRSSEGSRLALVLKAFSFLLVRQPSTTLTLWCGTLRLPSRTI
jgi:hypothetical protein